MASCSNNTERNVMRDFYDGIESYYFQKYKIKDTKQLSKQYNIDLELWYEQDIPKCDLAVQFGVAKERSNDHHQARQKIKDNSNHVVYIETPVLGRNISGKNKYQYYRVGVDGFLNNNGIFLAESSFDNTRLDKLRKNISIPDFQKWKDHKQGAILILVQLPGDASMRNQKVSEWLTDTIEKIREMTSRKIIIRLHPAMSGKGRTEFFQDMGELVLKNYQNIFWSDGVQRTLEHDVSESGICVSYTSGGAIDVILLETPVITLDEGNLAYPICSHRIEDLENPILVSKSEIDRWVLSLANSQWDVEEMRNGTVWTRIRTILKEMGENV